MGSMGGILVYWTNQRLKCAKERVTRRSHDGNNTLELLRNA